MREKCRDVKLRQTDSLGCVNKRKVLRTIIPKSYKV